MNPSTSSLSAGDLKLLNRILDEGHDLEKLWPQLESVAHEPQFEIRIRAGLERLKEAIAQASRADAFDLQRLAFHERDLHLNMTAKHLSVILVPFERLRGRALRDDEFLVAEGDRIDEERDQAPLIVIADNLRSSFNVGAIMRTAEAFGAEGVWLSGYTPTPADEKTARTSMGTDRHIEWITFANAREALAAAKSKGYQTIALETAEDAEDLGDFQWPEKSALLLGNERFGIDRDLLASVDHIVRIPLHGRKNSLNVGIAFGIACADWRRSVDGSVGQSLGQSAGDFGRHPTLARQSDEMQPIGFFRSQSKHPYEAPRQGSVQPSEEIGVVELISGRQFEQALSDLQGFERIWLIYRFHHNENWKPKVMPPRGPAVKRGVFATRSPYRPNALGLSCVELVGIDGLKIMVRGYDLLDGTPIYDIKPYLPYSDSFPQARAGWTEALARGAHQILFSEIAARQIEWLEARGVTQIRGFLLQQLEYDPLDRGRKRVELATGRDTTSHRIAYRTWRADFKIDENRVHIERISSGYSELDLADAVDPHADKPVHREFIRIKF